MLSFEQIRAKFGVPSQHFYGYLQIRHFIHSLGLTGAQPVTSPIDSFLLQCQHNKKIISYFYKKLQSLTSCNIDKIKGLWHRDLATEFGEEAWSEAIASIGKIFLCNRLTESQYRILHRLQRTPQSLNTFYPDISPLCGKCKREVGSYIHCIWHCPLIFKFWGKISQEINLIFSKNIQIDPVLFLLNLSEEGLSLSTLQQKLLYKLLLLARRCILFQWIKPRPPTVNQWYGEIFKVLPMERVSSVLKGNESYFDKLWAPFLNRLPGDVADLARRGRCNVVWCPPCSSVST